MTGENGVDQRALLAQLRHVLPAATVGELTFLARGEYSLNYLLTLDGEPVVARLVTGSQIGLSLPEQVAYEAHALELLAPSRRTPRLVAVARRPGSLAYPFLVETYLPGRPLAYATDLEAAGACLADIHAVPIPPGHRLQPFPDPGPAIVAESREWAANYLAWHGAPAGSLDALRRSFAAVDKDRAESTALFHTADLVIVNYDLNTHNFIVDAGRAALVDWEKARVAPAVQDLAHFLLPTTTLWRAATATRLTHEQERRFLDAYLLHRPGLDSVVFARQLALMKRLIALRAVSWCSWALHAAAHEERAISNSETLAASRMYLEPAFLEQLFGLDRD